MPDMMTSSQPAATQSAGLSNMLSPAGSSQYAAPGVSQGLTASTKARMPVVCTQTLLLQPCWFTTGCTSLHLLSEPGRRSAQDDGLVCPLRACIEQAILSSAASLLHCHSLQRCVCACRSP